MSITGRRVAMMAAAIAAVGPAAAHATDFVVTAVSDHPTVSDGNTQFTAGTRTSSIADVDGSASASATAFGGQYVAASARVAMARIKPGRSR